MIEPIGIGRPVRSASRRQHHSSASGGPSPINSFFGHELRSVKVGRRRLVIRASIEEYVGRLEEAHI